MGNIKAAFFSRFFNHVFPDYSKTIVSQFLMVTSHHFPNMFSSSSGVAASFPSEVLLPLRLALEQACSGEAILGRSLGLHAT